MNKYADVKIWAIALVIKELRMRSRIKQYELAEKASIKKHRMGCIETASCKTTPEELGQIAAVFDLDLVAMDQLIQREIQILTGEIPAEFSSQCINYLQLRDEKNHKG